jgi:hypothetical protein
MWLCAIVLGGAADDKNKYGAIEVVSQPNSAVVYIEGFPAGEAPVRVDQVLPGPYRVVVKGPSLGDFVKDIQVTAGEIAKVEASLLPDAGSPHSIVREQSDWTPLVGKDKKRYEKATSTQPLRGYKVLEIGNFLVKSDDTVPPDHLYALFRDLAKHLDKKTKFEQFVTNYTKGPSAKWAESSADAEGPTLILTGVITQYERGNRAERYFFGFGAGTSRTYCLFRLVDKATNEVLLERMDNGSVSGGLFGGGSAGAMNELAEHIAKSIEKNW